jgi:exopolysaccharide biosynthesis polyprenyl glycosylphosphotransferase
VPVREVVLDRDIRSPFRPRASTLLSRYALRRVVSVATLVLLDLVALLVAAVTVPVVGDVLSVDVLRLRAAPVVTTGAVMGLVFSLRRMYGLRRHRHRVSRVLGSWLWVLAVTAVLAVLSGSVVSGWSLIAFWVGAALVDVVLRRAYDLAVALAIGQDLDAVRLLCIGPSEACAAVEDALIAADPGATYVTVARIDGADAGRLPDLFHEVWPTEVVIGDIEAVGDRLLDVIEACRRRRCPLKIAATERLQRALTDAVSPDAPVLYLAGYEEPVFLVKDSHERRVEYVVKRVLDVALAGALLVLLSPVLLSVALAVKLSSPGPVLFVAPRIGLGQRTFPCYKFRTMVVDAQTRQEELEAENEADGCLFKICDDPRLTRVGRFLRRTSLDELPQLFNVLRGQMSLVGPRPLPVRDVELMEAWHKRRHVVLPGMTGLWQVSGRSELGFEEMVELDFRYIETWSLRRDLAILARTAGAVFASRGAY